MDGRLEAGLESPEVAIFASSSAHLLGTKPEWPGVQLTLISVSQWGIDIEQWDGVVGDDGGGRLRRWACLVLILSVVSWIQSSR